MNLNLNKLTAEFRAAGLTGDCSSTGRVDFADGSSWRPGDKIERPEHEIAAAILAAHDPTPTYAEQRAREYPTTDEIVRAMIQRDVDGQSAEWDAIVARRAAVKKKYPKPGGV